MIQCILKLVCFSQPVNLVVIRKALADALTAGGHSVDFFLQAEHDFVPAAGVGVKGMAMVTTDLEQRRMMKFATFLPSKYGIVWVGNKSMILVGFG